MNQPSTDGCPRHEHCRECDNKHIGICLSALRQLIVTDPFTGYEGSFQGFLKQYPRLLAVLKAAEETLGKNSMKPIYIKCRCPACGYHDFMRPDEGVRCRSCGHCFMTDSIKEDTMNYSEIIEAEMLLKIFRERLYRFQTHLSAGPDQGLAAIIMAIETELQELQKRIKETGCPCCGKIS